MCLIMKSEKEQLVEFSLFIANEFGMGKFLPETSKELWLEFPISGIRQTANDMLEATQDIKGKELEELDVKLRGQNLPTITNMRNKGFKKLLTTLSRNKLKNEEEWRLLRSFLENDSLNPEELTQIQRLLDDYEFKNT